MARFGIDFGTTNSVLAAAEGSSISTVSIDTPPLDWDVLGFDKVLPSVIATKNGKTIFGWEAKQQTENKLQAVKRLLASPNESVEMGGVRFPLEQMAATLFRHIKSRAESQGLTMDQAVVTIPANSRGNARLRTKIAAGLGGIEVLALINEPTAAAMAFARTIQEGERVLVYDFGGGTLDVTVLRFVNSVFMEEASKGIGKLGGIDLDDALAAAILDKKGLPPFADIAQHNALLLNVEQAKIKLSSQESTNVEVPGGDFVEVTLDELNRTIAPFIQRSGDPVKKCLADLGGDVKPNHLVLVGGTSKIPYVQSFVAEIVGLQPLSGVDPMTAVAEGAALAAAILKEEVDHYDFFVGTEHALGTIAVDPTTQERVFSVLIPRNNMLPAEATDFYTPVLDHQESINVEVIEGDPDLPLDHDDNVVMKCWDVKLAEARPRDEAGISITYQYDVDGILRVRVVDLKTGAALMNEELTFGVAKQDLARMKRDLDTMMDGDTGRSPAAPTASRLDPESQMLVDKVSEKILPFVDEDEQLRLRSIIADLEIATPATVDEAKRRLGQAMREHAYLL